MSLNYIPKLQKLIDAGVLSGVRGVVDLHIEHDDWCKLMSGHLECNCDPDIRLNGKLLKVPKYN